MAGKTGNTLVAVITGVVVGLGAGILFAPEEGKKTRKRIKKSFDEQTTNLKGQMDKIAQEVKAKTMSAKGTLEENVETLVSKSSYKADEVISVLEKKLADLKKANAKLQK